MSKKAAESHKKASEHLTHAARHHTEAAKHHEAGTKKPRTMRKMRGLRRLTPESTPKMQLRPTLKSMAKNRIHIANE